MPCIRFHPRNIPQATPSSAMQEYNQYNRIVVVDTNKFLLAYFVFAEFSTKAKILQKKNALCAASLS